MFGIVRGRYEREHVTVAHMEHGLRRLGHRLGASSPGVDPMESPDSKAGAAGTPKGLGVTARTGVGARRNLAMLGDGCAERPGRRERQREGHAAGD